MKKRYKVVNKKRFLVFITSILTIMALIISSLLFKGKAHSSLHKIQYYVVEVKEGDTLWEIARKNLPEKTDIRKMIYEIQSFNDMDTGYIYPGDIIKIPTGNIDK